MNSIITEIENRVIEHPEKLMFAFLDIKGNIKESYKYKDFDQRTKNIAFHIQKNYKLTQGDRILLAYPPGLEMIYAFFSCVKLGLIPVPVYPPSTQGFDTSVKKMNFIAQDCNAKAVLTDRTSFWSYKVNLSRQTSGVSKLQWIVSDDAEQVDHVQFPKINNELLFIQYTSGSTDQPKGVMVTHENILQNCDNVVDHLPIGVSWLPQYHDMGFIGYYLFFAIKGGTTYGISPSDFIQRPAIWLEAITKYKATASSAPNFAYEYCLTSGKITDETLEQIDLSSLRFLMNAAEPIKPTIYKAFLAKFKNYGLKEESFFCAYGLAEYTLAVSNYGRNNIYVDSELLKKGSIRPLKMQDKNTTELMSCGRILANTEVKIIDTTNGNCPTSKDGVGEIWLHGSSKCIGYWNKPDLNKKIFQAKISSETDKRDWLKTGDLGFIYDNELYVCGRLKDLIIIRGLNYYPNDIEGIIEKDPLIRKGSVVAFSTNNQGNESLVIVAGIKNQSKIPDANQLNSQIVKYFGIEISEILFVPARAIPKTSSGKIRRSTCKNSYLNGELNSVQSIKLTDTNSNHVSDETENIENVIITDYTQLLLKYKLSGIENSALRDVGLDSLRLAEFGHDLKLLLEINGFGDLSHEVDLKLLQRIIVVELFEILKDLKTASSLAKFKFRKAFQTIRIEYDKSELNLMARDILLPLQKELNSKKNTLKNNTLLTGGTGFFGPFLIKSILEQTTDNIYVLVRADSEKEAFNRLQHAFNTILPAKEFKTAFEKRVQVICGDLSKPKFGLSEEGWSKLSDEIHTIYHNGAYVNYMMDYESMRQINVIGTKEVIQLALTGSKKILNHISTTFIFGWSVKETLFESDSNSAMEYLDFGYSQSKWVSEQLVIKAMRDGLQARIFRPALISPSINGTGYNFDISIRLLTFMLKYGIGTSAQNQVSFTPADIGANNIVAISTLEESLGNTFHATRDEFSTMEDVTNILGDLAGKSFVNFDLISFVPEVVGRCAKEDLLFPLLNFLVKSVDNISAMEFKKYDNSNYMKFRDMSPWGIPDPSLKEVVNGIYQFMINNNEISESLKTIEISTSKN